MAEVAGLEQVWTAQGFHDRFAPARTRRHRLRAHQRAGGAGPRARRLLAAYLSAVHEQTTSLPRQGDPEDLDRVVDRRWDPPVTLGVRLVSVVNDGDQHLGQAAYVRGLLR